MNRRNFFGGAALSAVAVASVSRVAMAALPEPVMMDKADTAPPLQPSTGRPYNPVVTLNGWTCPWRMNQGVKEFHLVAEPVVREIAPGMNATLWGYNGQSPGPTIEVVEGDRVRIFVTPFVTSLENSELKRRPRPKTSPQVVLRWMRVVETKPLCRASQTRTWPREV